MDDLEREIIRAVQLNGGPFKRIILISHAGGGENGPAASLGGERLTAGNISPDLRRAVKSALTPDGIVVIVACGYFKGGNKAYKGQWLDNLLAMSQMFGHVVFASDVRVQLDATKPGIPIDEAGNPGTWWGFTPTGTLIGYDPDGNPL